MSGSQILSDWGLSPRSRGNRCCYFSCAYLDGTIPALAGEPYHRHGRKVVLWDYPRARGGTFQFVGFYGRSSGLSPRSRGNPLSGTFTEPILGTIPALAGEPYGPNGENVCFGDYPRARGGTDFAGETTRTKKGLSPRSRGNPGLLAAEPPRPGTIPALAGEPRPGV